MGVIKPTNSLRTKALLFSADDYKWTYNLYVLRRFVIFGFIKVWFTIDGHSFSFPRYSNSPHSDGLSEAMRAKFNQHGYAL